MSTVQELVSQFTEDLQGLLRDAVISATSSFETTAPAKPGKKRGRPPGSKNKAANGVAAVKTPAAKPEKPAKPVKVAAKKGADPDRYRCPVPKCQGKAAPIFGMVCAKHKDMPKAQVNKFRAARAAAKLKAAAKK